jgi:3' exoribonuclease, RNase T-like
MNVMIDIKTMGSAPGSAVLSIGAVCFGAIGCGASFYEPISLSSCTATGLTINADSVSWWMRQSDAARNAAIQPDARSLAEVLTSFSEWFAAHSGEKVWCHGASLDVPILDEAFRVCELDVPWKACNVRDARTLYDLADIAPEHTRRTLYQALDDAVIQANAAIEAYQKLGLWPAPSNGVP